MKILTQYELKKLLDYNLRTGNFVWACNRGDAIKSGDVAGTTDKDGYRYIHISNKRFAAHRLAFLYVNGSLPREQVDHINHNPSDNAFSNLRECTASENQKNKRISKNNKSGLHGVSFRWFCKKWRAYIRVNMVQKHLGEHKEKWDAICARKSAENKYNFHPNHGK